MKKIITLVIFLLIMWFAYAWVTYNDFKPSYATVTFETSQLTSEAIQPENLTARWARWSEIGTGIIKKEVLDCSWNVILSKSFSWTNATTIIITSIPTSYTCIKVRYTLLIGWSVSNTRVWYASTPVHTLTWSITSTGVTIQYSTLYTDDFNVVIYVHGQGTGTNYTTTWLLLYWVIIPANSAYQVLPQTQKNSTGSITFDITDPTSAYIKWAYSTGLEINVQ